jgi:hypothetical protein
MITDKETFIEAIKSHLSLQSLISGIILSQRCSFFLLSSKTLLTTDAILSYIQSSVETASDIPLELNVFRPNRKGDYRDMLESMVRPLVEHEYSGFNHRLYVLDFTGMGEKQEEIAIIFQRLNEMRNTLIGRLDGSLLVVLPFGMEREFAIRAPDLWSIRSSMCMMDEALSTADINIPSSSETTRISVSAKYTQNAVSELSDDVTRLRELYRTSPSRNLRRALLVVLHRYGNYMSEYGGVGDALLLYDEALNCAKELCAENPDSLEAQRDLSVSYAKLAQVQEQLNNTLTALRYWEQCANQLSPLVEKYGDVDGIAVMLDDCNHSIKRLSTVSDS